ncbi:ribosome maturation factor RimM [Bacillus luteolus]|uniref:Ribosome maturation factor RimM n=1 Tax=Litchfieldia luteola TaxID=682179 RepID=A0ABR9QJS4_9BACI|nr:ribosome maturation factor RimM [Cytobacillus luteolus]MBE4908751.1 ribosome maturation factor RimM [Cytobacillus luteolus]MBP1941610.1 16S rRNA processing protein RimM [Cytobacillus luteolus]
MAEWFNVGKIVNTQGIKGEVRVISRTDFTESRYKVGNTLYLFKTEGTEPIEVTVKSHRVHKTFDLLTFEGYNNLDEVEKLRDYIIRVPKDQLGELKENEYYFHEIIGCTVFTEEGEELGKISEILTPGANDVWVVKRKGGKDVLIPYIEEIVKDINISDKVIKIHLMEGLL